VDGDHRRGTPPGGAAPPEDRPAPPRRPGPLQRFLYEPDGRVRMRHMIGVLAGTIAIALFGSFLLVLTPTFQGEHAQTVWVLFSVFLLKMPLVALLWWFIVRNKEWPVRPPRWSDEEVGEILAYLEAEAERSLELSDRAPRLAYLQGEAWNVADRVGGQPKVDAVRTALRINEMSQATRGRRRAR
jgi:hypothetical protein